MPAERELRGWCAIRAQGSAGEVARGGPGAASSAAAPHTPPTHLDHSVLQPCCDAQQLLRLQGQMGTQGHRHGMLHAMVRQQAGERGAGERGGATQAALRATDGAAEGGLRRRDEQRAWSLLRGRST